MRPPDPPATTRAAFPLADHTVAYYRGFDDGKAVWKPSPSDFVGSFFAGLLVGGLMMIFLCGIWIAGR
jgi:hypothetical protein